MTVARRESIHTCFDPGGCFSSAVRKQVRPFANPFLFDYQATGDGLHEELTLVPARSIHENYRHLLASGARVWLRCPFIPSVNTEPEHLRTVAELIHEFPGIERVDLLPYHRGGIGKWRNLGMEPISELIIEPDEATKAECLARRHAAGAIRVHGA